MKQRENFCGKKELSLKKTQLEKFAESLIVRLLYDIALFRGWSFSRIENVMCFSRIKVSMNGSCCLLELMLKTTKSLIKLFFPTTKPSY